MAVVCPTVFIFVAGYLTSNECASSIDTYNAVARAALDRGHTMKYITFPNNNTGDLGNTTVDTCLEHATMAYNSICDDLGHQECTIVLAGHSMGGLLVARMISMEYIHHLHRLPTYVRMINPAIRPTVNTLSKILSTFMSYAPELVKRTLSIPSPVAEDSALYPNSPCYYPLTKPRLVLSMLQRTNALYRNNTPWNLIMDTTLSTRTRVIHCTGDTLTCAGASAQYATLSQACFVPHDCAYHQHFTDDLLQQVFVCA